MYFKCQYCGDKFKKETTLIKHLCENRKKVLLLESNIGKSAYISYQNWRNLNHFFYCDKDTFLNSKYFKSFINFVEFCKENSIPEKNGFIKMMVEKKIQPSLWINDLYYEMYISEFDNLYSPMRQVEMSLEVLYRLSDLLECKIHDIFSNIKIIELLKMIHAKKLSPWLLLLMKSFQHHIKYNITEEEQILLSTIINSNEWKQKFIKNKESMDKIKNLLLQLNI